MTPERHEEVGRLFHTALDLEPSERTAFLHQACAGDSELHREVESLLLLEQSVEGFLETPIWQSISTPPNDPGSRQEGIAKFCPRCRKQYPSRLRFCPEDNQRLSLPDPYHLVNQILADKYRIEALVGMGGMGAVYLAQHLGIDRRVAFKILQPNVAIANDQMIRRFEQEAKVIGHLFHKNIADIKDAGRTSEGIAYLVMEWLDGCTLDEELVASGPFAMDRASDILRQISAALEAAHSSNIIHCDLKPSNIMLNKMPAGSELVKVLDFGIAKLLTDPAGSLVSGVIGTPHYASPEQLQAGGRIDARSDLYSLGVILFQMLTGKLPFQADSLHDLIRRQMELPAQVSRLRPDVPDAINWMINRMLSIDPAGRPQSAGEVAAILDRAIHDPVEVDLIPPGNSAEPVQSNTRVKYRPIGREAEYAELQKSLDLVAAGRGQLVCVTGEPGIGKTTVVEEFLDRIASEGKNCFVARGRCSERLEGTGAYLPLLDALDGMIHGPGGERIDRLLWKTAPSWRVQIAPLRNDQADPSEKKAVSLEQMKWELKNFFQTLSLSQPVVLFLDDIHWSDISTIDLLAFLGSKFDQIRLQIITTYRPSELLLARSPFVQVMLDFQSRSLCREIAPRFFSRDEIERYLASRFAEHCFPQEFPAFLQEKTEGNPLFMVDLIRYLCDSKVIDQEGETWKLMEALPDIGRELPESVRGMIKRKINQLSDRDLRLLTAASVQGNEFDSAVLSRVLEMEPRQVEEQLDALENIHSFIRLVGEQELPDNTLTLRYRFVHGLYQNMLYSSLKLPRRASLSEALAEALLSFYQDKSLSIATDLALLFKAARKYSRSADYFLLSAQNAANVFAYKEAIVLARRGLELLKNLPDSPERTNQEMGLQIILGMSLIPVYGYAALDAEKAFTRARELCLRTEASQQIFPVLRGLSLFYNTRPKLDDARELGEQLLSLTEGQQDPSLHLEALFALSSALFFMGEFAASRQYAERAITIDQGQNYAYRTPLYEQNATVGCMTVASLALWALGFPDQALSRSREAVALARQLAQPFNLARALAWASLLLLLRGDWEDGQEKAEEAIRLSRQYGFSYWLAMGTIYLGYALFKQGRKEEGIQMMRRGLEAGSATGAEIGRPYFLALFGEALGQMGNIQEGMALIDNSITVVSNTSERSAYADIYRIKGELLLLAQNDMRSPERAKETAGEMPPGSYAEAENYFRQAIESARRQEAKSLELKAVASLSRLLKDQGREEDARQVLAEICGWFTEGEETMDLRNARRSLAEMS